MTKTPKQNGKYELGLGGSFLQDLPSTIKRFTYCGESDFFDTLETESARFEPSSHASEFLLFHASKATINTLIENEDASPIARYHASFDTNEQLFLVRMPLPSHPGASGVMNTIILEAVRPMGLLASLQAYPSGEIRGASRGKQAEYAWGPQRTPRGVYLPYSVTLEVALSENDVKLNSDVRFWLSPDEGKANICLTLQIGRSKPETRIEKWENQNEHIHRSQAIWVTECGNQICVSDSCNPV